MNCMNCIIIQIKIKSMKKPSTMAAESRARRKRESIITKSSEQKNPLPVFFEANISLLGFLSLTLKNAFQYLILYRKRKC